MIAGCRAQSNVAMEVSSTAADSNSNDILAIKDSAASKTLANNNLELPALSNIPQNLEFDKKTLTAKILGIIDREWVALKLNELFVIEYYSRKI